MHVTVEMSADQERRVSIEEEPGEPPTTYVLRDLVTQDVVGRVPGRSHADLDALLSTGLPVAATLEDQTLTLALLDE
jgi:hypothetical protein